jgi:hypothetical protein
MVSLVLAADDVEQDSASGGGWRLAEPHAAALRSAPAVVVRRANAV